MENKEIVKKKRGRKPKDKSLIAPPKEKKKRGRKPKPKSLEEINKLPKKRGRKPKKIVSNSVNIIKEEPIILHLPIKNLSNKKMLFPPKPFTDNNINYKNIDNTIEENINININNPTLEELNEQNEKNNTNIVTKFNKLCSEYNNIFIERDKVLPIFLEYNEYNKNKKWPDNINICCLWCCHEFDNFPFGIPIKKVDDTYYMFGNFCSGECAAAYNFENTNTCEAFERYSLLNYLYSNNKKIKLAGPKLSLKMFGGQLSIKEFRNNNNIYNKNYKLLIPPMISIIPVIEEINILDNTIVKNNEFIDLNNDLKLKRSKPLPDSFNTLENCMNLKLV